MDPDRLRTFVATEYPRVVAAVTLVCGDGAAAEDSVQEALARACEQVERGVEIRNLAAWVTTVASNHSRTGLRRRGREQRAALRLGARREPPPDPTERIDALVVHRAVTELPRRQRQAVVLRYFLGLDVTEVGIELGIAEGTAKALLYQARHRLAAALGDDPPHEPEPVEPPARRRNRRAAAAGDPTTSEVTP